MAQDINISKDLYDLLVAKNFDPNVSDAQGRETTPDEGTVFKFDYVSSSGKNYGTAVIIITEDRELLLFFGDNLGKSMEDPEDKDEWFRFLQQLSKFSTRHNFHTFTPKNLNQIKHTMAGMAALKEGLFEGYYGTKKVSYMGEATDARLVIKHNRLIGEGDARFRYVESLFIETAEGERYKLPFTKLSGGRAMLEHVRQGGKPYDVRGVHIAETVQEMNVLARFNRANQNKIFEGDVQHLVEAAGEYYKRLKENIKHMASSRGYAAYFESWSPADINEEDQLVEDLRSMFVEQTLDTRIEAALPTLVKIQKGTPMKEADQFEAWANRLTEGTWALPETPEQQNKLRELLSNKLIVGPDAANATEQLYDLIGDDQLFDDLGDIAKENPNADVRDVVVDRLRELGYDFGNDNQVSEADNLATFEDAVADFLARGGSVQHGKYHNPRKSEKTDYGSKHIGGVRDAVAGKAGKTLGRAASTNFKGGGKAVVGEGTCNHTMEGEYCPVHGLAECATVAGGIAPLEEAFGSNYAEQLAQQVYDDNPELDASGTADEVMDVGFQFAQEELGGKRARYMFAYDEDFPSDFVSAYAYLQQGGAAHVAEESTLDKLRNKLSDQGYTSTVDQRRAERDRQEDQRRAERDRQEDQRRVDRDRHNEYMARLHRSRMDQLDRQDRKDDAYTDHVAGMWDEITARNRRADDDHYKTMDMFRDRLNRYQYGTQRDVDPEQLAQIANIKYQPTKEGSKVKEDKKFPEPRKATAIELRTGGTASKSETLGKDGMVYHWQDPRAKQGVAEGSETPEKELERLKLRQNAWKKAPLRDQAATQARIRELEKQIKGNVDEGSLDNPGQEDSPVAQAIIRRILMQRTDLLAKYGPEKVNQAVDDVADYVGDVEEIGSSDVSGWVREVERNLGYSDPVSEDSTDPMDHRGAVTDSFYESQIARMKKLALGK